MNDLLKEKLKQLKDAEKGACWYLVKQPTSFFKLCYLVSFLEKYKLTDSQENFETYISNNIGTLNAQKGLDVSDNYRALLVASYFGLIQKTAAKGSSYKDSLITPTYYEVKARCNGEFEKVELYQDIVQRQLEKIYLSTAIDDEYEGTRAKYKLYPVMFLYKILLELGKTTGEYSIFMNEYEYLVDTSENYEDYLKTLMQIYLYREDENNDQTFSSSLGNKFDNRFKQALKQLPTLVVETDKISLNMKYLSEVSKKIFYFEKKSSKANLNTYFDFLGSTKPLITFDEEEKNMPETKKFENYEYKAIEDNSEKKFNRIVFGAPGTGKSHQVNKAKDKLQNLAEFERVTFHPNYSYAQFVGTYKPVTKDNGDIAYKYVEGPFMRLLTAALENAKDSNKGNRKRYLLIIEEINRANVAAVFGDMFQLLDRDTDGVSDYEIQTSEDVRKYLAFKLGGEDTEEKYKTLKLPNNFYIWATMNSADQGVQPMDAAFKRRWNFEYLNIDSGEFEINIPISNGVDANGKINTWEEKIEWNTLRKAINETLKNIPGINEDKLIGPFFLGNKEKILQLKENKEEFNELFKSKILMYLFEDVVKMNPGELFSIKEGENIHYSDICKDFDKKGLKIFVKSICDKFDVFKSGEVD